MSLLQSGQLDAARKIAGGLRKANRQDPESWYLWSLVLSQQQEFLEAIQGYLKVLELSPGSVEATYNLALCYQLAGKITDAIRSYRECIRINPSFADAHFGLGNCWHTRGQYREAMECFRTALQYNPQHTNARMNLGIALQYLGDRNEAEIQLSTAARQSNSWSAWLNLGMFHQANGALQDAHTALTKALEINPASGSTWLQFGSLLGISGQLDQAANAYRKAIDNDSNLADARYGLGAIYLQTGSLKDAMDQFRQALEIDRNHVSACVGVGMIKLTEGDYEAALESADKALAISHNDIDAIILKARIYEQMDDIDKAKQLLQPLIDGNVINAVAGAIYANICQRENDHQKGIDYLEMVLANGNHNNWSLLQIHFALGKLYDAVGHHATAFTHYKIGNDLKFCNYDPEHQSGLIHRMIRAFPPDYENRLARAAAPAARLVFVVGMPRSGTSLVEQILSCHPNVAAGGELTYLYDIIGALPQATGSVNPYPECLVGLTSDDIEYAAAAYLKDISSLLAKGSVVTDKLPANFLHLGFISLLFPNARIIHCARDPVDTCLSCYFQQFAGDISFTYNLDHLSHYYREYRRLMAHWERVLAIPMLTVQYEELVQNQEQVSRELLDFCGLDWDPRCLDFSNSTRFVRTSSYDQVRRPLYRSSMARWEKYQDYLGPLQDLHREFGSNS